LLLNSNNHYDIFYVGVANVPSQRTPPFYLNVLASLSFPPFAGCSWDMSKKSVDPNFGEKIHPLQQEEWHPDSSHNMKKPRK